MAIKSVTNTIANVAFSWYRDPLDLLDSREPLVPSEDLYVNIYLLEDANWRNTHNKRPRALGRPHAACTIIARERERQNV